MASHSAKDFKVTTTRCGMRSFGEHDDRSAPSSWRGRRDRSSRRRGGGGRGRNRGRGGTRVAPYLGPRSRLEDDDGDIAMDDQVPSAGGSRYVPYGGRPKSRRGNYPEGGREDTRTERDSRGSAMSRLGLPVDLSVKGRQDVRNRDRGKDRADLTWAKITVINGQRYEKEWLIRSIQNFCSVPFQPVDYHHLHRHAHFYVDDKKTGDEIKAVTRRITTKDGKVVILMKYCPPPVKYCGTALDAEQLELLKNVMSKRFNVTTQELNLSNLYNDEDLQSQGIRVSVNKQNHMDYVIKIIEENVPQIHSLDLSNNRMYSLDSLQCLVTKAPNLKILRLGRNTLRNDKELEKIKRLKLDEIVLDGNPLCDNFSEQSSYIRAIRKHFPKLVKLDGHELPPSIGFDLDVPDTLPEIRGSYFVNDNVKTLILNFLEQYYSCYDSGNRQKLIDAYHEKACFSLTIPPAPSKDIHRPKTHSLSGYVPYNRSLNKIFDAEQKFRLLKQNRLSVVACLDELPDTQHDLASFVIDVSMFTGTLLSFCVSGIFKEMNSKDPHNASIRSFSRTFLTVPAGSGLSIINDQLSIGRPSLSQLKGAFATPAPTPSTSPVPPEVQAATSSPHQIQQMHSVTQSLPSTIKTETPELTPEQQQMVQSFSKQSGMNLKWSYKCLAENGWNYENSARIFTALQAKGSIPPEAFVK